MVWDPLVSGTIRPGSTCLGPICSEPICLGIYMNCKRTIISVPTDLAKDFITERSEQARRQSSVTGRRGRAEKIFKKGGPEISENLRGT